MDKRHSIIALLFLTAAFHVIAQVPTISSFTPTSGPIGTTVIINGTNFSTTPGNNIVFFGATQANVTAATTTQLTVTVPTGATYQPITVTVNGLTTYSRAPFIVTFTGGGVIDINTFLPKVDFTTGDSPTDPVIGDVDGDGKPDLIVASSLNNIISVFRNTSAAGSIVANSFATQVDLITQTYPRTVALGDIDGDGKPDLVVANYNSSSVSVFRNTSVSGAVSFATRVDLTASTSPSHPIIRDMDGDGKPDLVVVNLGSGNTFSVFRNTGTSGSISFATRVNFTTGPYPQRAAIGDVDGDGKPDVAVTNLGSGSATVSVFRNTSVSGSASFASKVDFITGIDPVEPVIADVDGDGKPDLVVTNNSSSSNSVSVFRNTSASGSITGSSFAAKVDFATGTNPGGAAMGDLDGDSKPDLVVANGTNSSISVFRNISTSGSITTGSFASRVNFATENYPSSVAIGDVDGDGKPDLVVSSGNNTMSVFRYNFAPEPTTQPINLTFSNITTTSARGDFTSAAGNPDGYIVFLSEVPPDFQPVDGTTYPNPAAVVDVINGKNVYPIDIGNSTFFTVSGINPEAVIYFHVHSYNGSGSTINYLELNPLSDNVAIGTPPLMVSHTPANSIAAGASLQITAQFSDPETGIPAGGVKVLYNSAESFQDYNYFVEGVMSNPSGNTYTFTIPGTKAVPPGIVYLFEVTNGGGIVYYSENYYKVAIDITGDGLTIPFSGFGSSQSNYRIVSVPLDEDGITVGDVLEDDLGSADKTKWRMFHYNGTSTTELDLASSIDIGKGYWLIVKNSGVTFDTGPGKTPAVSFYEPFMLSLQSGWNQIGNPYSYDILWQDIKEMENNGSAGLTDLKVFKGSFANGTELEAFSGGFVFVDADAIIEIPIYKNPAIQGGRVSASSDHNTNPIEASDWEVNFTLTSGDLNYSLGGIGMSAAANTMFDLKDEMNLPRFLEYLELAHKKELHGYTISKDVVPTEENHEWEFSVKTNVNDPFGKMQWDNSYFGTNSKELVLWDVKAQRAINMREQNQYTFTKSRSGEFKVFFGSPEFVKEKTSVEQLVLHPIYPNPAADQFVVSFALPQQENHVTIVLCDLLGRKVSTVTEASFEAGYHEVPFQFKGMSGMYLIQLNTGHSKANQRLIIKD